MTADRLGYSDRRAVRRPVQTGRRLLAELHAWPWACWPDGQPPRNWWRHGDAAAAAALERWQRLEGWPPSLHHERADAAAWRSGQLTRLD